MTEQILALCWILVRDIDARPFGFPQDQARQKEDRDAVLKFALQVIKYGHP